MNSDRNGRRIRGVRDSRIEALVIYTPVFINIIWKEEKVY